MKAYTKTAVHAAKISATLKGKPWSDAMRATQKENT